MGINQTLLLALLPQIAKQLNLSAAPESWSGLIVLLNLNLLTSWLGAAWWGQRIHVIGPQRAIALAAGGFSMSIAALAAVLASSTQLGLVSAALIAGCRLAAGCFSSALLPIAQSQIHGHQGEQMRQLAKLSSHITLGRLVAPALVFIPLSPLVILLFPACLTLLGLPLARTARENGTTVAAMAATPAPQQSQTQLHPLSQRQLWRQINKAGLATALLTTAMVASLPVVLLPLIHQLGFSQQAASEQFSQLMLVLGIIVIATQRLLVPVGSRYWSHSKGYPLLILACLYTGGMLLSNHQLPASTAASEAVVWSLLGDGQLLLLALTCLAVAVAALPSWYTQQLFRTHGSHIPTSQISGAIAQAHTIGHILGTLGSALLLASQLANCIILLLAAGISVVIWQFWSVVANHSADVSATAASAPATTAYNHKR